MRINLRVPYEEKEQARRLGAKWDTARRIWYVENMERLEAFLRWMPDYLTEPHKGNIRERP